MIHLPLSDQRPAQPFSGLTQRKAPRTQGATLTESVCPYCAVGCGLHVYGEKCIGDYGPLHSFFLLEDHPNEYNLPEAPVQPLRDIGRRYAWQMLTGLALTALSALIFHRGARHAS